MSRLVIGGGNSTTTSREELTEGGVTSELGLDDLLEVVENFASNCGQQGEKKMDVS